MHVRSEAKRSSKRVWTAIGATCSQPAHPYKRPIMRFQPTTFPKFAPSPHRLQLLIRTSARLLAVTLAIISASCGTSPQPTPSSPSTTDTQAPSPLPLGIYTNDTLPSRSMTLTLLDGGRYTLKGGGLLFQGTWTLPQHEPPFNLTA